nr:MAG TPA: hypothetical protein [Caudoviricetes sp.]
MRVSGTGVTAERTRRTSWRNELKKLPEIGK